MAFAASIKSALICSFVVCFVVCTAIGNSLVICAILFDKSLRLSSQNNLVLSLAVADLLVAVLVTPMSGIYLLSGEWLLGIVLCDVWTSADVFSCTGKSDSRLSRRIIRSQLASR